MEETKRGFIVIGELPLGTNVDYLWSFIRKVKWPVLVESLSNMRTNIPEDCIEYVITTYDALLKNEDFKKYAACRYGYSFWCATSFEVFNVCFYQICNPDTIL